MGELGTNKEYRGSITFLLLSSLEDNWIASMGFHHVLILDKSTETLGLHSSLGLDFVNNLLGLQIQVDLGE